MYNEITSNKRKTFLIIAVFFGIMIGLGWVFSFYFNSQAILYIAVIISIIQALVGYYQGDKIALAISGAKEVKREQAVELHRIVENLCITAGLPKPKIYVIDDTAPNAFATGRDAQHASIAVTRGLMEKLENEELEGVIAHELSHVGNRDILVLTVSLVLVGAIALLSDFFMRSLWFGGHRDSENRSANGPLLIIGIALAILAPIIASLLQLAVSRKREYLADASGALLTRYPEGLARALEKIAADKEPLEVANKATAMLYIENPLKNWKGGINNLFSTHPPVQDRVKRLREMA